MKAKNAKRKRYSFHSSRFKKLDNLPSELFSSFAFFGLLFALVRIGLVSIAAPHSIHRVDPNRLLRPQTAHNGMF